jgi:hypothetical protein
MQETIAKESPRRHTAKRIGAAGVALAAVVTLGACKATGGGYIAEPLSGGPVSVFQSQANFGFNFTCQMKTANKALIQGEITYHDSPSTVDGIKFPEIRVHGVVDPFFVTAPTCEAAAEAFPDTAQFEGDYRSQDTTLSSVLPGRFVAQVFDEGEPSASVGDITGDSFTIELIGGPYAAYTRGGYIEGGNIQVDNT